MPVNVFDTADLETIWDALQKRRQRSEFIVRNSANLDDLRAHSLSLSAVAQVQGKIEMLLAQRS